MKFPSLGWEDPQRRKCPPTPVFLPGESPWTEEPGGLQSMGSQRVGHNWSDWARILVVTVQSVQWLSCVRLLPPHGPHHARPPCPSPTSRVYSLMPIESVMPSNHLILCRLLFLPRSIFPSIRVFSNESAFHIRWSKYWSFNFNISTSNEYLGLISFRMDWLDLLAVQGILKGGTQNTVA